MRFALHWGEHKALLDSLPDDERPVEPEVPLWAEQPWRAWSELSSERHWIVSGYAVPMGGTVIQSKPGPIPWTSVQAWCDRSRCGEVDRQFVVTLVGVLDREFIADWQRKQLRQPGNSANDKLSRWENTPEG